jgi:hypothetical protein
VLGASAFFAGPTFALVLAVRCWRVSPRGVAEIAALSLGVLETIALVLFLTGVRLSAF